MIEEYARHDYHADLIRELVDGSVGWRAPPQTSADSPQSIRSFGPSTGVNVTPRRVRRPGRDQPVLTHIAEPGQLDPAVAVHDEDLGHAPRCIERQLGVALVARGADLDH
jgi:hypothetical protein